MNGERFREVYEATERSWESTAAQWMVVFDIVKQSREASLAPLEKAVWETYRQAQELRALVTGAWEQAQLQSRDEMRQQTFAAREAAELDLPVIPSPDPAVRPEPVVMPAAPLVMAAPAPVPPAPAPRPVEPAAPAAQPIAAATPVQPVAATPAAPMQPVVPVTPVAEPSSFATLPPDFTAASFSAPAPAPLPTSSFATIPPASIGQPVQPVVGPLTGVPRPAVLPDPTLPPLQPVEPAAASDPWLSPPAPQAAPPLRIVPTDPWDDVA